jgi:hypothetical protein
MLVMNGTSIEKDENQNEKAQPSTKEIVIVAEIHFVALVIIIVCFTVRFRPGRHCNTWQ